MTPRELAEKNCRYCPNANHCQFACMNVILQLWADCKKSPHELNEMMKRAREELREEKR